MIRMLTVAALLACLGGPVIAKPAGEVITDYEAKAKALTDQNAGPRVAEEIGTLRAWLGEAKAYLAAEKPKLARQRIELAGAQIALIEASTERARIETQIRTAEDEAKAKGAAAAEMRNVAFGLEQRLAELEEKARAATPPTTPAPGGTP